MPRGVAIPELQQRLFAAAARLLVRDGPAALTSRAITDEAGCAKGVLHNHFIDLDGFLAEFALDCFRSAHDTVREVVDRAGRSTVRDNLLGVVDALFASPVLAVHGLLVFQPSLVERVAEHRRADGSSGPEDLHRPGLRDLESTLTAYLDAEKGLGRIRSNADVAAVAVALVATAHRLMLTAHPGSSDTDEQGVVIRRVIDILIKAIA